MSNLVVKFINFVSTIQHYLFMETREKPVYNFNRNEKQNKFNEIRGVITEKNDGSDWCSFTLNVGHENPRLVNLAVKKDLFDMFDKQFLIGDKVAVNFYLACRFKNERWYTSANILNMSAITPC